MKLPIGAFEGLARAIFIPILLITDGKRRPFKFPSL